MNVLNMNHCSKSMIINDNNKSKPPLPRHRPSSVPQQKAASWSEPLKVSETTIRNVQALKHNVEQLRAENRELRQMKDEALRQASEELSQAWQHKMHNMRHKWHNDKEKSLAANASQLQRHYEQKIEAITKLSDKEIHSLQIQVRRSQERIMSLSQQGLQSGQSQESLRSIGVKSTKSNGAPSTSTKSFLSVPSVFRRHSLSPIKVSARPKSPSVTSMSKSTTEEVLRVENGSDVEFDSRIEAERRKFERELRQVRLSAQKHVKNLLDELRAKEKQIERFEHSLAAIEQRQQDNKEDNYEEIDEDMMPATSSKINPNNKFLGGVEMMSKDVHEREKQRWQLKIAEVEILLKKSDESVSDLNVTKAELNKRIVELEKNQKPLNDNNRRFTDRNRILMTENKKLEEKMRHLQEDFMALRSTHERVAAENNKLKDKRVTPEKLDELDEYKQQNLDYCRCITVLKQATIEKDRKIDLLQKKLRAIRRNRTGAIDQSDFDDNRSEFSTSSISLDTITEDMEEVAMGDVDSNYGHLSKEHIELQRAYASLRASASAINVAEAEANIDRQRQLEHKLRAANEKIAELEECVEASSALGMDSHWAQEKLSYCSRMKAMQHRIEELQQEREQLNRELDESREDKELLEFQVLEMEQTKEDCSVAGDISVRSTASSMCDQAVSTSDDDGFASSIDSILDENNFSELPLDELKIRFTLLKHRRELKTEDRMVVMQVKQWLENLQNQHEQCKSKEMQEEMNHRQKEMQLKSEIENLQKENVKLDQDFKVQTTNIRNELVNFQDHSASLEAKLVAETAVHESSKMEIVKLRQQLRIVEETAARDRTEVQTLRKKMSELGQSRFEEIDIMEKRDSSYVQEVNSLKQQMRDCQNARDRLLIEKERLSEEKHNLSKALASRPSENDLRTIEKKLKECQAMLQHKESENRDLKQIEAKLRADIGSKNREYTDMKLSFEKQLRSLVDQLDQKETSISDIEKQQIQLKSECAAMQQNISQYQIQSSCAGDAVEFEKEIRNLNTKLIKMRDETEHNNNLVQCQRAELEKWTVENQKMRQRLNELESVNEKLKQTQLQLTESDKQCKDTRNKFRESLKIIQEYETMDKEYNTKLQEATLRADKLQEELTKLKAEEGLDVSNSDASVSSAKLSELQKVSKEQAQKIHGYKKELSQAKNYQSQLEQQFQMQLKMVGALKQQLVSKSTENVNALAGSKDLSILLRVLSPFLNRITRRSPGEGDNWEEKAVRIERNLSEVSLNDATSPDDIRKLTHIVAHILRMCGKQEQDTEKLQYDLKLTASESESMQQQMQQLNRQYQQAVNKLNLYEKKYASSDAKMIKSWHEQTSGPDQMCLSVDIAQPSSVERLIRQLKNAASDSNSDCVLDALHELENYLLHSHSNGTSHSHFNINQCESPDDVATGVSPTDDGRSNSSASGPSHAPMEAHSSLSSAGDEDESSMSDGAGDNSAATSLGQLTAVSSITNHDMWRKLSGAKQKRFRGLRRGDLRSVVTPKPCNLTYKVDASNKCISTVEWDLPMCVDTVIGYKLYINGELTATCRDRSQNVIQLSWPVPLSPFVRIYMTSIGAEGSESQPTFAVPNTTTNNKYTFTTSCNGKPTISFEQNFGTSEV